MRSSSAPPPLPRHVQQGAIAQAVRALPPGEAPSEIWRSAALAILRLNAREVELLALLFEEEETHDDTRRLVLDLLAGAGTFEVQATMRRLLSLAVARRSNRTFAVFVQRLGFLEEPDGPTLRYLMSVYGEARGEPEDVRAACAYALGACAGRAHRTGDENAAVRATEMVRRDLFTAETAAERRALLLALGNAGLPNDLPAIVRAANDPDPQVRAAAAVALRKLDAGEARAQLTSMIADIDPRVGESAIIALSAHALDEHEVERVAELVAWGRTHVGLDGRLLRLLVTQRGVTTAGCGPSLEIALRFLLGRLEAAGDAAAADKRFVDRTSWSWVPPTGAVPGAGSMTSASGSSPVMRSPSVPVMHASGFIARPVEGHPFTQAHDTQDDLHAFPPSSLGDRTQCEDMRNTVRGLAAASPVMPDELDDDSTIVREAPREQSESDLAQVAPAPPVPPPSESEPDGAITTIAAPIEQVLAPGIYRLVPGEDGSRAPVHLGSPAHEEAVAAMRRRLEELGLDPDARTSMLPLPPTKSANGGSR